MTDPYAALRARMVAEQVEARGIHDPAVLAAMRRIPRHRFVFPAQWPDAYEDRPVPIGMGQTVSQPFIVGYMAAALEASGRDVLEVGTGSGYQTAVLAIVARRVLTVEIEPELSRRAAAVIAELGVTNVSFRVADGLLGWPGEGPFSRIVLTAAAEHPPGALLEGLEPGGRFIGPVGPARDQRLLKIVRGPGGFETTDLMPVLFVQAKGGS